MSSFNMPGDGGDSESNANIQSLLAQLRLQSGPDSPTPELHAQSYQAVHNYFGQQGSDSGQMGNVFQSSMDSPGLPPAPTPPVHGLLQSHYPPGLMAQFGAPRASDERTANLLNLLKFSGGGGSSASQPQSRDISQSFPTMSVPPSVIHAPAPAAADPTGLLAALMKGNLQSEPPKPEPAAPTSTWNASSPSSDTQQYLLNLLNRRKPSQSDAAPSSEPAQSITLTPQSASEHAREASKESAGGALSGSADATPMPRLPSRSPFDIEPKNFDSPPPKFHQSPVPQHDSAPKPGMFSYTSPFEELSAASPHKGTPKTSATPSQAANGPVQILKKPDAPQAPQEDMRPGSARSPASTPEHGRRMIDQTESSADLVPEPTPEATESFSSIEMHEQPKEAVSDAIGELAETADKEAQEALARAEHEQAQAEIAKDLEDMMNARTDEEFVESAKVAAQAIKKELEKEENRAVLESALDPEVAQAVKDIVDEAATGNVVADSWESADADEVIVVEEAAPPAVKVYNFPMKPWISISILDGGDERPTFRDDAIVDIARLKKEFDQIDRNLVAASETYIAYGMSKAGGLRVIRQDDGKDGKLFTDTKDRIFNVAMSSSTADPNNPHKEAIIGTGVSGSVYWVQVRNGEKDHLEDAHPEQYGFVLPPINTQEGDAPGGVLKTRARTSSSHPDYFAVGRGKSINIIWPSFIMQNHLFKPGHDRVVDTERLFKQCSLRINTGKAGKDFTFSQDDTTVVSLDKSGRVKFWDVRDLTAMAEGTSLPLQTSLEVREPLMTLTTTPEGEKAWPTSVLLLDKQRPYQKRTALRYMIVGMKQNHTLQLWDLALGKPVQEFNLPHSKESDAVCSVMYHPPTGMIVIGHPTRNSVYFLHLSAPKYTLKNLSQVDYVQRLVAQDSSIPYPESTAVISGIREYSFENKGVLRSLDILENPVNSPATGDGQALFELYSMHSKGVTCLVIKQGELGWTKDNKVDSPVDAVASGLVKIEKLHSPPAETPQPAAAAESAPVKIVSRASAKDTLQKTPSSQGDEHKGPESATPPKIKLELKELEDGPAQTSERSEKKGRKKRAAAAAAAAATAAGAERDLTSNGNNSSHLTSAAKLDSKPVSAAPLAPFSPFAEATESDRPRNTQGMESRITSNITSNLTAVLESLDKSLESKMKSREAAFETRQTKLLEMVSEVLNENTQKVLTSIVRGEFDDTVAPVVRDTINKSVSDQLGNRVGHLISQSLQKEMHKALPGAVVQSFARPEIAKAISDRVVSTVLGQVENEVVKAISGQMIPAFTKLAAQAAQRVGNDIIRQVNEDIARLDQHRHADGNKIDQLVALSTKLSHTVSTMAASQTQLQNEILNLKQTLREHERERAVQPHVHAHGPGSGVHSSPAAASQHSLPRYADPPHFVDRYGQLGHIGPDVQSSSSRQVQHLQAGKDVKDAPLTVDQVIDLVSSHMRNGNYHEAIVTWLKNDEKSEAVFKSVLVNYNPQFIADLSPLVLLSVGSMVTKNLVDGEFLTHKLAWTELVLLSYNQIVHSLDPDLRQVTPKIMSLLKTRLEQLFLQISSVSPRDPVLKNLTNMTNLATRIIDAVRPGAINPHSPY